MGLNFRIESDDIGHISKETRYRVWWSLYTLDTSLCAMTGRPPSSNGEFCTTPLPVPFKEEQFMDEIVAQLIADHEARNIFLGILTSKSWGQSNVQSAFNPEYSECLTPDWKKQCEQLASSAAENLSPNLSLYFFYFVELGLVMRESVDTLYAPGAAWKSWREIESAISTLDSKTDAWFSRLPDDFRFTGVQGSRVFERQTSSLAFGYYSTKLIIIQPCLRHAIHLGRGASSPGSFCDSMTDQCVDTAMRMLSLLPDPPDTAWLYRISPWWCILHYLMQATTVLLTELFIRATPGTPQYNMVQENINKAIRWLPEMAWRDPCSQRAWIVCNDFIGRYAHDLDPQVMLKD